MGYQIHKDLCQDSFAKMNPDENCGGRKFLKNFLSSRDGPVERYRNKAEMKTRRKTGTMAEKKDQKTTIYLLYLFLFLHRSKVEWPFCVFSPLYLVFVLFTGPSLLEIKFSETFSLVSVLLGKYIKQF